MKKVVVRWRDISGLDDSWSTKEEYLKQAKHKHDINHFTVGWLLENNNNYVVIASTTDNGEEQLFHDGNMILKSAIISIKNIQ